MRVGPIFSKGSVEEYQYLNDNDSSNDHLEKLSPMSLPLPTSLYLKALIHL